MRSDLDFAMVYCIATSLIEKALMAYVDDFYQHHMGQVYFIKEDCQMDLNLSVAYRHQPNAVQDLSNTRSSYKKYIYINCQLYILISFVITMILIKQK